MTMTGFGTPHMPPLGGATTWLNSPPLAPADLGGNVVLVDFWTLTCINWLRTGAYIRAWARAYRDDGLVVIGVHTPEFSFEHDVDLVRQAVAARDIDYPVAVDNDYRLWSAFDNHYWPALYFVGTGGEIRDYHFGEGRYEESEQSIQELLDIDREPVPVEPAGIEAPADWDHLRTPETYLGAGRSRQFASADGGPRDAPRAYGYPQYLQLNQWALDGSRTRGPEHVALAEAGGSIAFRFQARDAHLVLSAGVREPVPFQVFLDGTAPGRAHGGDVDADGHGVLREGRLYQLVREPDTIRERTLEITFAQPGARAYCFTFG
jgi:thiol-disulfide isomerase/thioredoxin